MVDLSLVALAQDSPLLCIFDYLITFLITLGNYLSKLPYFQAKTMRKMGLEPTRAQCSQDP